MWIYITGCIVAFIALIITHLKYEDILTVGDLIVSLLFSILSWVALIALFVVLFVVWLLVEVDFTKPIIKRKK
jgi:hypothetical protein